MSREASTKYYQKNKERIKKSRLKDIKILLKKKKAKSENMVFNNLKNLTKDEKQKLAEYRKRYYEMRKNNSKVAQ